MSVIGRLDEQTDAVLIKPIGRRSGQKGATAERDSGAGDEARSSSPAERGTPGQGESSTDRSSAPRQELPVWLL